MLYWNSWLLPSRLQFPSYFLLKPQYSSRSPSSSGCLMATESYQHWKAHHEYIKNTYNSIAKKLKPNLKMARGAERTVIQRRHKNGQHVCKKVLNIPNHHSSLLIIGKTANQNHDGTSPHIRMAIIEKSKKKQALARV